MNCKQARSDIALFVGDDLQESSVHALQEHVANCTDCRSHLGVMQETIQVFDHVDAGIGASTDKSMWPALSGKIRHIELASAHRGRFNGWVPAMAIAAACILIAVVSDVAPPTPSPVVTPRLMETSYPASQTRSPYLYSPDQSDDESDARDAKSRERRPGPEF